MFKNMRLSMKITFGFAIILILAGVLGLIAIWNMLSVRDSSATLRNAYVEEVAAANNVERFSLLTMYSIRGYAFSEDDQYLIEGRKHIEEVNKYLNGALELSAKYPKELDHLKQNAIAAQKLLSEYAKLLDDTEKTIKNIASTRLKMDAAAGSFVNNCNAYVESMNSSMVEEIKTGVAGEKLEERMIKISLINDIIDQGNAVRIANYKGQATEDTALIESATKDFDKIALTIKELRAITVQTVNLKQLDDIKAYAEAYKSEMDAFVTYRKQLDVLSTTRGNKANEVLDAAKSTAAEGMKAMQDSAGEAVSALDMASNIMIIGLIIVVVIGIALAVLIVMSITRPVNRVVQNLAEGAQQVSAASNQLSSASQQLAEGSTEQASAIEETSSTLQESSSMVQQNAENTKQAALLSGKARDASEKGNQEMKDLKAAMNDLKKSSDEIAKIIKVIDEIAFQTNILALNAAVEAARAGEAGMGFAVVAEEVRNLAQRSAQAAKDTATIIERNIALSVNGVSMTQKVSDALGEISGQAKKVNELMDEISAAGVEQAQGIEQINKAISQMEQVIQQNASTAEESASASEELNAQAETLEETVIQLSQIVYGSHAERMLDQYQKSNRKKRSSRAAVQTTRKSLDSGKKTSNERSYKMMPKENPGNKNTHVVKPEDVIPLDQDSDNF